MDYTYLHLSQYKFGWDYECHEVVGDQILYEQRQHLRNHETLGKKIMSDITAKNPVTGEVETRNSDEWKVEAKDDGIYFLSDDDNAAVFAEAEEEAKRTVELHWQSLRLHRNSLLAETDWWGSSDLTMTDEQKAYRQALRDVPANTSDPLNVSWPQKP